MRKTKPGFGSALIIALVSVYLVLPLLLTFVYSLFTEWTNLVPTGFTLGFYAQILSDRSFLLALLRTMVISVVPVLVCLAAVLLAMYVIVVYHPEWEKYMQVLCTIPYALQGIILAISILSLYSGAPQPFSNRFFLLTGTYCVVVLPYMYRGIRNSLNTLNAPQLIQAAQLLGASRIQAYWRVVVPNIRKGVVVSALLGMALLFGDFAIVNTIGGSYYETAQMHLYRILFRSGQLSSAVILVLFFATLVLSGIVFWLNRKGKEE
ncbi:MAG: ABC transporter permease [Oscillospiraceae bacterium]